MTINTQIFIKENDSKIARRISEGIRDYLNQKFPLALDDIKNVTKRHLFDSITSQPEYNSIRNGKLKFELGLIRGEDRLLSIIDKWLTSISVKFTSFRVGKGLIGGIKLEAIRSDYRDIIQSDDAILETEKGEVLPWLRWLLLEGGNIIIGDYRVNFGPWGRTGGAIMVSQGTWGISPEFAGVRNDNFVTRSIEQIQNTLIKDIERIIERIL